MNTLISYIESVFDNLPHTPEMERLKNDMLMNMEEKYEELLLEGFSENEAIGTVLTEFGNIDEIIQAYDLKQEQQENHADHVTSFLTAADAQAYLDRRSVFATGIGLGAALCIFAPASLFLSKAILGAIWRFFRFSSTLSDILTIVPLFLFLAIGVGLFILLGIRESQYSMENQHMHLDPTAVSVIKKKQRSFKSSFAKGIASGVILCVVAPISFLLSLALLKNGISLGIAFLLSFVALGVFLFVYYGVINDAYDKLLSIGEHDPKRRERERKSEAIASIVFPLAGILYVIVGLLFDLWGTAWIIFPILGLLFAGFEVISEGIDTFRK